MLRNTARLAAGLLAASAMLVAPAGVAASDGADHAGHRQAASAYGRVVVLTAPSQPDARLVSPVTNPVSGQPMYHPVNPDGPGV